ncbi:MAG: hypothetical protein ACT4OI_06425 [Methanobacteriota archaeon]
MNTASRARPERIRIFLIAQAATFLGAAMLHLGLVEGSMHLRAGIAESVIAPVLLAGLIGTWLRPAASRGMRLAAQGFALAGTIVGVFTVAIGIGPGTVPDLVLHATMVLLLVSGLTITYGARVSPRRALA